MADISGTLSMARKAGKLVLGMDEVKNACKGRRACGVIVARDLSSKSLKEIKYVCATEETILYGSDMTMDDVGACLGKVYGIIAVTDKGFMKSMAKKLKEISLDDVDF